MNPQPGERDDGEDNAAADAGRAAAAVAKQVAADEMAAIGDARVAAVVASLRQVARAECAAQAARLRLVARLASRVEATVRRLLAAGARVPGQPDDAAVIATAVTGELTGALGIGEAAAGGMLDLAGRLTRVLPDALGALEAGRIELARVRVLAEETRVLDEATAREVVATLLAGAGDAPWDAPSPRAWRERARRAVTKADPDSARRRREEAIAERAVRTWLNGEGTGTLHLRAADVDILLAEQVITALALAWPATGPDGQRLSMAQRRVDAVIDVFRRLRDGQPLPTAAQAPAPGASGSAGSAGSSGSAGAAGSAGGAGGRDVGIVLPADTLVGDGPAAADPGQLRGMGTPAPLDPYTARQLAEHDIAAGAGVRVFLTDQGGALVRLVRLMLATNTPGEGRWTRQTLTDAVRAALPGLPALRTDRYAPTAAIIEHVRARNPHCAAYDCPRVARRCDLDHDIPWPRGPTDTTNLSPRCRRHHESKTRGLVRTRLAADGTVTTGMLSGLIVTTRPEPLPGYGPGEGYAPTPNQAA